MSADLHCHTKLSDGSLGIDDLVILARKQGVETIAITDKNCQAGNVRGKLIGERHGIRVIHGVELSSVDPETGKEVDVICYLADSPDRLEGLCRRNTLACRKASQYMIIGVSKRFSITADLVVKCATGSTNIYIQHIMRALMESGYTTSMYGELYEELFTPGGESSIYVQPKYDSTASVIEAIHEAGGIVILPHPGTYDFADVEKYVGMGIDGIEVWSPANTEEQTEAFLKYTKKSKLLATGGTDFHGLYNKSPLTVGEFRTPKKNLDELLGYKAKQKRLQRRAEAVVTE